MVNLNGKSKKQLKNMLRTRDKWLTPWQMRGRVSISQSIQNTHLKWDEERKQIREAIKEYAKH